MNPAESLAMRLAAPASKHPKAVNAALVGGLAGDGVIGLHMVSGKHDSQCPECGNPTVATVTHQAAPGGK